MKIYNVITTNVCKSGSVEVSVRSTTEEHKAHIILEEERSKLEECFDEKTDDIFVDKDDMYGYYGINRPLQFVVFVPTESE